MNNQSVIGKCESCKFYQNIRVVGFCKDCNGILHSDGTYSRSGWKPKTNITVSSMSKGGSK